MNAEYKRLKDQIDAEYQKKLEALEVIFGANNNGKSPDGDISWKVEQEMVKLLKSSEDAMSLTHLRKGLESNGTRRNDIYLALRRLVHCGKVSVNKTDKKRGGARYWLAEKAK